MKVSPPIVTVVYITVSTSSSITTEINVEVVGFPGALPFECCGTCFVVLNG